MPVASYFFGLFRRAAYLIVITLYPSSNSTNMAFFLPRAKILHKHPLRSGRNFRQNQTYGNKSFILFFLFLNFSIPKGELIYIIEFIYFFIIFAIFALNPVSQAE